MLLYLLRHAEAVDHAVSDAARALTEKGIAQAAKVGKFCLRNDFAPEIVLSSPYRRAEQTATLAAEEMNAGKVQIVNFLASGMDPANAAEELAAYLKFRSVMIVGHEPDFSRLAAFWLGLPSNENIHLRKASLTLLIVRKLAQGAATLDFSLPVRSMS
jgi:phosphohistidine phosphatase